MPKCFVCYVDLSTYKQLCTHITLYHQKWGLPLNNYICLEEDCKRKFFLFNSFKKHLKSHQKESNSLDIHANDISTNNLLSIVPPVTNSTTSDLHSMESKSVTNSSCNLNIEPMKNIESVTNPIAKFASLLYANSVIPLNVVQEIMENLSNNIIKPLLDPSSMHDTVKEDCYQTTYNKIASLNESMKDFESEHKRLSYFKRHGTYIEPQEYTVGQRLETKYDSNNHCNITTVKATAMHIPLNLILKNFFEMDGVLEETLQFFKTILNNDSNLVQNIIKGSEWQKKLALHEDKIVFPLCLFFDDYEVGNALGSHSGVHKLGAVYISVMCIPPHKISHLGNIFLSLLFHSSDRQKFGNNVIFAPVISDLNNLLENGIEVYNSGRKTKLYFELAVIIGDNLGIHTITGFAESFSSNYPCRICKITKETMRKAYECDESLLRTMPQYMVDVELQNVSATGIKDKCVWHEVKGFSVIDHVGVDIMHDLLEGVCKYDMSFIVLSYITDLKYFSLEILNNRIISFNYGPDRRNTPPIITLDHLQRNTLKMSAAETLCFVRYFGLLVGDLIPDHDAIWNIYICLRKIMDIVMSTVINKSDSDLLKSLISEHNFLYLAYSKKSLTPKFHYLTHYPQMLIKFGPLVNIWSMRYEAKHRISKLYANVTNNRINICKSLAIKHQLQLNNKFISNTFLKQTDCGRKKSVSDMRITENIACQLQLELTNLYKCNWVTVNGIKYTANMTLTLDFYEDKLLPKFGLIENIFIADDYFIILECSLFDTLCFNEHLYCFDVELLSDRNTYFFSLGNIASYVPNNLTLSVDGKHYHVTPRSSI